MRGALVGRVTHQQLEDMTDNDIYAIVFKPAQVVDNVLVYVNSRSLAATITKEGLL